ncbi:BTAD domain-containing putative transcriptional regulator [Desulfobacterales bacterium HSG2]|nr:BTAD domain-containing putative transcriptional regulator [Desulfobacterales bacterium HSG2]
MIQEAVFISEASCPTVPGVFPGKQLFGLTERKRGEPSGRERDDREREEQETDSPTKVTRPTVTGALRRNRLFRQLDNARERPVIWVSGPPGCGKTTLVSSYTEARGIPCLWYRIDEGDADVASFFYYMTQAVKQTARNENHLPLLTSEYLSVFTLRYFEKLYSRMKIPGLIVFDDYQEVPADSLFHKMICSGLAQIPEGINIILISRSEPPPVLIHTYVKHQAEILGYEDLRLTPEESADIVRRMANENPAEETLRHLHKITDGWVAGLVLILFRAATEGAGACLPDNHTPEEIFSYFASEIFDKTDEETRNFLLRTAFLPEMSVKTAESLTDSPHTHHILSELDRNNYFVEKFFHAETVYRYHPLFRDFLLHRAKEGFSEKSLSALGSRAAGLLEETGQPEAATALLRDVGDWDGMVRLILKHAASVLAQRRHRLLEKCLKSLPKEVFENTPWLIYWMGACRLPFEPSRSRDFFERAFGQFVAREDSEGTFMAWAGIIDAIAYSFEGLEQFDHWIRIAEELIHKVGDFPSETAEARVASRMFTALALRQPGHADIETWAKRAMSLSADRADVNAQTITLFYLAIHRILTGDFEKADIAVTLLRQLTQPEDVTRRIRTGYARALYYQFAGMHESCFKVVSDTTELARTSGVHIMDGMLTGQSVSCALNANDCKTAGKLLDTMSLSLNSCNPWEISRYHFLRAREALICGKPEQADFYMDASLKLAADVGFPFSIGFYCVIKAHVKHELGKNKEAARNLREAFSIAKRTRSRLLEFHALMTEAWFALDKGAEAMCLKSLGRALAIGKEGGYLNTFADQPAVTARLCVRALEAGIEVGYVRTLIRKRGLLSEDPPVHLDNWPYPVKIFTLGRFSLVRHGKPLRSSGKARQKPLSVLKALIAFGGREVREDQIADALWPDADGDAAHRSLATTLHRLRKLLGAHQAVRLEEGRLTLDQRYCWADVWAFERVFGQADAAWKKAESGGDVKGAVELTRKAVRFYHGPFLAEEPWSPWTLSLRERLRSKFLRGVGKLGHYWEKSGQWEKGAECYQRGLEVDNLAERFYQRLMTCYYRLGLRAEALTVYDRCKRMLSANIGIEPSPETEAIRKSLLSQKKCSQM